MENRIKADARAEWKRAYQKLWHAAHPAYNRDYMRKRYVEDGSRYRGYGRKATLKAKYGISIEEYDAKLEQQGGVCALCNCPPQKYRLVVDHCHETGKIRDLLCIGCNAKLHAFESSTFKSAAVAYLQKHSQGCL